MVGLLITFAGYLGRFFGPVGRLVGLAQNWARVAITARRPLWLIDARPDVPSPRQAKRIAALQAGLSLDHVSFSYNPGQPALRKVSLICRPTRARWSVW